MEFEPLGSPPVVDIPVPDNCDSSYHYPVLNLKLCVIQESLGTVINEILYPR